MTVFILGCNRTYTINHGHVNFTGTDASVNSSVSVTCEEGYKVHGPMYVTCLPEGVWSNDTTCVVKGRTMDVEREREREREIEREREREGGRVRA